MNRRKQILSILERDLKAISGVALVEINPLNLSEIDMYPLDSLFLFSYKEERSHEGNAFEEVAWEVEVVGITADDPEDFLEKLHKKIYENRTLDNLALQVFRKDAEIVLYPQKNLATISIILEIRYGIKNGDI